MPLSRLTAAGGNKITQLKRSAPLSHDDDDGIWSPKEKRRKVKAGFLISNDVLIEVLSYFDRRQLTKLELACRRFHWIILRCFSETLLLFFEIECYVKEEPRRFSKIFSSPDTEEEHCQEMVTGISLRKLWLNDETHIFFMPSMDFGAIPSFVRIKSVYMRQFWPQIIRLLPFLRQFSGNFINSLNVRLNGSIGSDYYNINSSKSFDEPFKSSAEFVSCLRGMLKIFEQCLPRLTFCVNSPQPIEAMILIASTLELHSVETSENVNFLIPTIRGFCSPDYPYENQVKVISNWMHRQQVSGKPPAKPTVSRSLTIGSIEGDNMSIISANCVQQLIDILKLRFLCSHLPCQPYRLKLVLKEKFQSVANRTLGNKVTNEQMNIQNRLVMIPFSDVLECGLHSLFNSPPGLGPRSYTEITVTRR